MELTIQVNSSSIDPIRFQSVSLSDRSVEVEMQMESALIGRRIETSRGKILLQSKFDRSCRTIGILNYERFSKKLIHVQIVLTKASFFIGFKSRVCFIRIGLETRSWGHQIFELKLIAMLRIFHWTVSSSYGGNIHESVREKPS